VQPASGVNLDITPTLRNSACHAAGTEKYQPNTRSAMALNRDVLGVPFYHLETYQTMVGVPLPDLTQ